jgi:ketosteroid isomerase-like protein
MSDQNTLLSFFEFVNSRDMTRLGDLLTDSAEFYFPKTRPLIGKKRILRFFGILFRQYPELVFTVKRTIVQSPLAAVHWTNRGTNRRGEPYQNEGVTILEMAGPKVEFISDFFKDTGKF